MSRITAAITRFQLGVCTADETIADLNALGAMAHTRAADVRRQLVREVIASAVEEGVHGGGTTGTCRLVREVLTRLDAHLRPNEALVNLAVEHGHAFARGRTALD